MVERKHIVTIEGLRGLSALIVLALHCATELGYDALLPHGALSVDFFFIISGFVVAHAYEFNIKSGWPLWYFVRIRLIRLYPMILFGLILGVFVYLAKEFGSHVAVPWGRVVLNILLSVALIPSPIIFDESWEFIFPFNGVTWSLFFEILINTIYAMIIVKISTRTIVFISIVGAVFVIIQCYYLGSISGGMNFDYANSNISGNNNRLYFDYDSSLFGKIPLPAFLVFGTGRAIFPFFIGVLLNRIDGYFQKLQKISTFFPVVLLITVFFCHTSKYIWIYESASVIFLLPSVLILAINTKDDIKFVKLYSWLGKMSYPLYLVHYPIVRTFGHYQRSLDLHGARLLGTVILEVVICVTVAHIVTVLYDEPVREWLTNRFLSRQHSMVAGMKSGSSL